MACCWALAVAVSPMAASTAATGVVSSSCTCTELRRTTALLAAAALPGRPRAALMEEEDLVGELGRDRDAGGQTAGVVLATEQDGAMRHGQVGDLGRGQDNRSEGLRCFRPCSLL
jgi:hypothetical protein